MATKALFPAVIPSLYTHATTGNMVGLSDLTAEMAWIAPKKFRRSITIAGSRSSILCGHAESSH